MKDLNIQISEQRMKYLLNKYNEFKLIREKEKKNPSPDHKGKMLVIKNELDRLSYQMCIEIGRQAYIENQKKDLTDD